MKHLQLFFIGVLICIGLQANAKPTLAVTNLRTNHLTQAIGIETPQLSWESLSSERNVLQTAYQIRAAYNERDLQAGRNLTWESGKILSDQSLQIPYQGAPLELGKRIYWQVKIWNNQGLASAWSPSAYFEPGFLKPADKKAEFITADVKEDYTKSNPSPLLRKEFNLTKSVKQARMYATAHGLFMVRLNGAAASNELFAPGWTSYNKRLQYRTYDITTLLKSGKNAVGVSLGDGWYRGNLVWEGRRNAFGEQLAAYIQIEITYTDGTTETILTDETWKASTGAIQSADLYNGEVYDARLEKTGWDQANYDDSKWNGVKIKPFDKSLLVTSETQPMQVMHTIKPISKFTTPKGELVFDMGQNMVGLLHFKLKSQAGKRIQLHFAEVLDKEGNFYTENLRAAKCEDTYYFKGNGIEEYQPTFTFHGFRYVKVSDFDGDIQLADLTGKVVYTAMTETGSFVCSDSLINRLQQNILWGLRGNFLDVPTDCPQRDERLGWTGDAQAFAPTACYLEDASTFFSKWLKDLSADQFEDGRIPHVVPDMKIGGGSAGWADVATIVPMALYESYADVNVVRAQYPSMVRWVEYLKKRAGNKFTIDAGNHFGDWLAYSTNQSDYPGATTDKDLIATAFFAQSVQLTEQAARLLGKTEDAAAYAQLFSQIKQAFAKEYMTPSGRLSSNTQTAYVLALRFNLIPDQLKQSVAARLAENVRSFGHLTTGFLGTPLLNEVLSDFGYHKEACMLLFRKDYPSWLYPVTKGATTIWERWDGIRPDGTFQDRGMNSFNHYAYGAVGNWLYSRVAGVRNLEPGYKKISIYPMLAESLSFIRADYRSVYGPIASHISQTKGQKTYQISIPSNTTAVIKLAGKPENIKESGVAISSVKSFKVTSDQQFTSIETGSGKYTFVVTE